MPTSEPTISPSLAKALERIVGAEGIVASADELLVYECDGYTLERSRPDLVVLPRSTAEVAAVIRLLHEHDVRFVPRGAGTGLSGGCLPVAAPVMISLSRMNRIVRIDAENRTAIVEAGVVNRDVSTAAAPYGLHYAPDPSSQSACTIGGNLAENSGGPHTLKYGVTTNHVLAVEMVLADGRVVELGGALDDGPGYDLRGVTIGCEGTFGLVTGATLRLVPLPQGYRTFLAVFDRVDDASAAVSGIIAAGLVPAALEMMDGTMVQAVEAAYHFGFPLDAEAVLIVEIDGPTAGFDRQTERIAAISRESGAREVRTAGSDAERALLWKSRKRAFGAVGRLAPNYCTQDGVVPRTRVPDILRRIREIGAVHGLEIANVFHAGDGNIHPIVLYDERRPGEVARVLAAGREILESCVALGGSLTGEHGIGVEKMDLLPLLFSDEDMALMQRVRRAFDPDRRCNPHKIFPAESLGVEVSAPARRAAL
ncbi:MAG: glycolate oxidase [Candidatus Binatota bacterium]|nr:glycolate oxidase [Candidatus Binatota bacterium]